MSWLENLSCVYAFTCLSYYSSIGYLCLRYVDDIVARYRFKYDIYIKYMYYLFIYIYMKLITAKTYLSNSGYLWMGEFFMIVLDNKRCAEISTWPGFFFFFVLFLWQSSLREEPVITPCKIVFIYQGNILTSFDLD